MSTAKVPGGIPPHLLAMVPTEEERAAAREELRRAIEARRRARRSQAGEGTGGPAGEG